MRTKNHPYERVILIGVDGAGSFFKEVNAPCFMEIFDPHNVTYSMKVYSPSLSAQNWGSMMYGVPPEQHGLTNETVKTEHFQSNSLQSIFSKTHVQFPQASVASIVGWSPINFGIIDCREEIYTYPDTLLNKSLKNNEVVDAVQQYLTENDPKLLFIHFDDVDHAGHSYGWGSPEYYAALLDADRDIGMIWRCLDEKGYLANALFIVLADHGGLNKTHGGDSSEEMNAVFAVAGRNLDKENDIGEMSISDVRAIVLYALGIDNTNEQFEKMPAGIFIARGERKTK